MTHRHRGIFDPSLGLTRYRTCGAPCDPIGTLVSTWRGRLPTLPWRWRTVAAVATGLTLIVLAGAWTLGLFLWLAWSLACTGGGVVAGYLLRRWHRPSAGLHYSNDDKTVIESIVQCEKFMRECIIEPAFIAPMLTTPKRRMPWPRFPYARWQALLTKLGSAVTTP